MDLKSIFLGIFSILVGLYFTLFALKLCNQKIVISNISYREKSALLSAIATCINTTFIDKGGVYITGLVLGIILIISVPLYIVYSRLDDVKYRIYNVNEDIYIYVIKKTLKENHLEFSMTNDLIEVKETPMNIILIDKGCILKKCKKAPVHKRLLLNFETNLKNVELGMKRRDWITAIIFGVFLIIFGTMLVLQIQLTN